LKTIFEAEDGYKINYLYIFVIPVC